MSIKGFMINGIEQKYDYSALENVAVDSNDIVSGAITADKLGDDVKKMQSSAYGIEPLLFIDDVYIKTVSVGVEATLSLEANSGMSCCMIPCSAGDIFYLTGTPYDNSNRRPYMFVDSGNVCLYRNAQIGAFSNQKVVAPEGAANLIINFVKTSEHYAVKGGEANFNNRILNNKEQIQALSNDKVDKASRLDCFNLDDERFGLECIHHDNFHRVPESEFEIGQNGNAQVPMTYGFLEEENTTYMIVNERLTNNHNADINRSVMFLDALPSTNFMALLGLPKDISDYWTTFVFNYVDSRNYYIFRMHYQETASSMTTTFMLDRYVDNIGERLFTDGTYLILGINLKLVFINGRLMIYSDKTYITSYQIDATPNTKVGIGTVASAATYIWTSINVFNIVNSIELDSGYEADISEYYLSDELRKSNLTVKQAYEGTYSDTLLKRDSVNTRFSPYSECFTLTKVPEDPLVSKRTEVSFRKYLKSGLFRCKLSFDLMIPEDYEMETVLEDDLNYEIITQFHHTSTGGIVHYTPTPALRLSNAALQIGKWGTPYSDLAISREITTLKQLNLGQWYHIEMFVQSGYEACHNPEVEVKVDGEVVYRDFSINAPNTTDGPAIHYGIYKYPWSITAGNVTERKLYFDNYKVKYM